MEERERKTNSSSNKGKFARQEQKLRHTQQQELNALLKRIEQRRQEHVSRLPTAFDVRWAARTNTHNLSHR